MLTYAGAAGAGAGAPAGGCMYGDTWKGGGAAFDARGLSTGAGAAAGVLEAGAAAAAAAAAGGAAGDAAGALKAGAAAAGAGAAGAGTGGLALATGAAAGGGAAAAGGAFAAGTAAGAAAGTAAGAAAGGAEATSMAASLRCSCSRAIERARACSSSAFSCRSGQHRPSLVNHSEHGKTLLYCSSLVHCLMTPNTITAAAIYRTRSRADCSFIESARACLNSSPNSASSSCELALSAAAMSSSMPGVPNCIVESFMACFGTKRAPPRQLQGLLGRHPPHFQQLQGAAGGREVAFIPTSASMSSSVIPSSLDTSDM